MIEKAKRRLSKEADWRNGRKKGGASHMKSRESRCKKNELKRRQEKREDEEGREGIRRSLQREYQTKKRSSTESQ